MIADEKNTWPEEWYIDVGEHLADAIADDDGMALKPERNPWPERSRLTSNTAWYLPKHFDGFDED